MTLGLLILVVFAVAAGGAVWGRRRAVSLVGGDIVRLHSLPRHYGQTVAILSFAPAILVLLLWMVVQPILLERSAADLLSDETRADPVARTLALEAVRSIARGYTLVDGDPEALADDPEAAKAALNDAGIAIGADIPDEAFKAAIRYSAQTDEGRRLLAWSVVSVAVFAMLVALARIRPDFRARLVVERAIFYVLIGAASIAILTTIGIILSLLSESLNFFRMYPAKDFFFNLTWNPQFRGGSDLGIIPLLWGTLYVSAVALLFAVPVGLFSAIYLAEYASSRVRSVAKPIIEVLAGIPTIVYGLFALITVGPMLRDYFAEPAGFGDSSSSVLTAGLVMGLRLIPFVSSLSDDVINAVPQSLRDGSYGLGATPSETVRLVILPAALPGIVGAILLAASSAIGETMIVVMGAGAAAKLSLNPFEAMTTITVKIVSQLTGDTEFASPETLVAFALGLSLFVITLGLNVVALHVVRKYREQYE